MDEAPNNLAVRFHFNGQFINDGRNVCYVGGREELTYIDRDKISLPEVVGHLKDHCSVEDGTLLHWLFPGKDLKSGLRVLVDDMACLDMSVAIVEGEVAEIYVEMPVKESEVGEATNLEDELEAMDDACSNEHQVQEKNKKGKEIVSDQEKVQVDENDSSSDSDYLPGDDSSSEEDEEAVDIMKKFKEFKKTMRAGQRATLDDIVLEGANHGRLPDLSFEYDGNETSYADSSDDEDSFDEEESNGQISRKQDLCLRYKKAGVPQFQLGMKFRSKRQFKKAIIRYGLSDRRVLNFVKDDTTRVKFEVQHFDNRFSVDLEKKECSCRYWQLSGLPCHHAISCIYFKTNSLEDYIAPCYSVEEFKKTYSYCLEPVEGMNSWPVSDRPKLKAPGYVRMPGRPKKERRREATEAPKGSRMSKVGTIIRCSKCKQTGHNRSTCERHATTASATVGSQSIATPNANPNAHSITTTTTTQSYTYASKKRKASTSPSTKATIKSRARASVSTGPGGNASVQLVANVPRSSASASATINITTGKATAKVSASAPNPKKSKPNPPRPGAMLLLPPWASDKL